MPDTAVTVRPPVQVPGSLPPPSPHGAALAPSREYRADEHLLSVAQLCERFGTSLNEAEPGKSRGLSAAQVLAARAKHGLNQLSPPKETPEWLKFLLHFTDGFMVMLMFAGALCFVAQAFPGATGVTNYILGGVLYAIVFATVIMNYQQDRAASAVMSSFKNMIPSECTVLRDGAAARIPAVELVPGDVVLLSNGDRVPADIRVLACSELKVECSSLTGEPDSIPCSVTAKHQEAREARNLAFNSSLITSGSGVGVVVKTGDSTLIGNVAGLATTTTISQSSMEREVHHFVLFVAKLGAASAIVLFSIGVGLNSSNAGIINAFVNGFIVVVVANVPEGLPATVVSCLLLTSQRLGKRNVFVKKTDIIETLGSATVIASDKTGTLTMNKMTVSHLWHSRQVYNAASKSSIAPLAPPRGGIKAAAVQAQKTAHSTPALQGGAPPPASAGAALPPLSLVASPALSSADYAGAMAVGRTTGYELRQDGADGTSRMVATGAASAGAGGGGGMSVTGGGTIGRANRDSINRAFLGGGSYMHTFAGGASIFRNISWERCDGRMRLGIIAGLCNSAIFIDAPPADAGLAALSPNAQQLLRPKREIKGDASESALLLWVEENVCSVAILGTGFNKIHTKPFNSVNKYALAVIEDAAGAAVKGRHICLFKGAPEIVLDRCTHYLDAAGKELPIDAAFKADWQVAYESFGFLGERVLGFAYRSFQPPKLAGAASDKPAHTRDGTHSSLMGAFAGQAASAAGGAGAGGGDGTPQLPPSLAGATSYDAVYASEEGAALLPTSGLVFVGLVSLVDPPRDGVKEAVERCRAASIKVTMVTGDHPITAEAIARQVSIITLPTLAQVNEGLAEAGEAPVADELTDPRVQAIVRAGSQIRGLTEAQWDALLGKQEVVFARTTPEQKLEIVEHYQRLGEVVAVTGDGVNDSPALKRANIGLAMGGADASDVAREAGDIILMDSNFASIVFAIEEGRVLFDNLKKSIAYTLAHLLPELLPVFLNLAFAFPLALPGLVILTIDLITEQGPAVSFASEPAESAVMLLPPRDMKRDRLVSTPLLLYTYLLAGVPSMVVCMIAYFCTYLWHGIPIATLAGSSSTYFQVPNGATPDLVVGGKVFNEELQYAIYMQSVGAWYATLIMNQFWHVWFCKTRHVSVFDHGFFNNPMTIFGTVLEILVMVIVVFVPGLNSIMITASFPGPVWAVNLLYLAYIGTVTEALKHQARVNPGSWVSRNLVW